jgi:CheY-like chemotaxis protein
VPALALTTRARPDEVEGAARAGYQRQLPKPPAPGDLTRAIAELGAAGN